MVPLGQRTGEAMTLTRHMPPITAWRRLFPVVIVTVVAAGLAVLPTDAFAQAPPTIDASDPRIVTNPIESSDPGTVWTCAFAGREVQCTGALTVSWDVEDAADDVCAEPVYSVNGTFARQQTRYYTYDAASDQYLEYKRLIHLDVAESLTPDPDPRSENVVIARLNMTWLSTFQTLGDLDSRITRKQGIDTFIKRPDGGIVVMDVGQKATALGEDFDLRGRWDIALGDPATEFGKVCSAIGL
jgi:hypothetical protein